MANLHTVSKIAEALGEHRARVHYIIAQHCIRPVECAGNVRLFSDAQVLIIKDKLFHIQIRRG